MTIPRYNSMRNQSKPIRYDWVKNMSSEASQTNKAETQLRALIDVMAKLRDPVDGCAWDLQQDHASIAPYTIEEAYEVQDAIEQNDMEALRDELGDLLLQVIFQARIGEESGHFDFADIAQSITDKMIRRHPHIFGDHEYRSAEEQRQAWEDIKAEERQAKNATRLLDDVATTLPAMMRAFKLQKRAARVGFDWPDSQQVLAKVKEELAEVEAELTPDQMDQHRVQDEIGDVLFSVINLARKLNIDPEEALKSTNKKFTNRFNYVEEAIVSNGNNLKNTSLDEMEDLWQRAKGETP